jgi:hypothetical protein
VSVKIKEVIDNNFKEDALIIPLACKSRPVKVLVIERENDEGIREGIFSTGGDEHSRQFLVEKDNDTNDKGGKEIKRVPLINTRHNWKKL